MPVHEERALLSAYLDGELGAEESARVEAHLATCTSCAATLSALRATADDLSALAPAALDARASWALRAALRREGRRARTARWVPVAAAASLAAIATLAVTFSDRLSVTAELGAAESIGAPIVVSQENYDQAAARAKILALAGAPLGESPAGGGAGTALTGGTVGGTAGAASGPASRSEAYDATDASDGAAGAPPVAGQDAPVAVSQDAPVERQVAPASKGAGADADRVRRCATEAARGSTDRLRPLLYEAASYEARPAYLLVFAAPAERPERLELWVMAAKDCRVLFFTQEDLRT